MSPLQERNIYHRLWWLWTVCGMNVTWYMTQHFLGRYQEVLEEQIRKDLNKMF